MKSKYIKKTIRLMRQIKSEERLKKVYTVVLTLLRIEEEGVGYECIRQDNARE